MLFRTVNIKDTETALSIYKNAHKCTGFSNVKHQKIVQIVFISLLYKADRWLF